MFTEQLGNGNMVKERKRGELIRKFILSNVDAHPSDIAATTAKHFNITRQAVNRHIQALVKQGSIDSSGSIRNKTYSLRVFGTWGKTYNQLKDLKEDAIWDSDIKHHFANLPDNVINMWKYGFSEMMNNVIDHSEGTQVKVNIQKTANDIKMIIQDNGIGIFKKIQDALGLELKHYAIIELAKGKLTTAPERHSGEGIFFTSRMFDRFIILSDSIIFSHEIGDNHDLLVEGVYNGRGTIVIMQLDCNTSRTDKEVFDQFAAADDNDYSFSKTVIPVHLAQYGDEKLVSRSQAKRILARIDKFKVVIFDFNGVKAIGQAFADEIFRVFKKEHPEQDIYYNNTSREVHQMIRRAESQLEPRGL
jgi:anti-sigma regulatory factor (Ser/Thr protein kinase)